MLFAAEGFDGIEAGGFPGGSKAEVEANETPEPMTDDQRGCAPAVPFGTIYNFRWHKWHNNSKDLAFNFKSSRTPTDVYSLNIRTGRVEQWTKAKTGEIDITKIIMALVLWRADTKLLCHSSYAEIFCSASLVFKRGSF